MQFMRNAAWRDIFIGLNFVGVSLIVPVYIAACFAKTCNDVGLALAINDKDTTMFEAIWHYESVVCRLIFFSSLP